MPVIWAGVMIVALARRMSRAARAATVLVPMVAPVDVLEVVEGSWWAMFWHMGICPLSFSSPKRGMGPARAIASSQDGHPDLFSVH